MTTVNFSTIERAIEDLKSGKVIIVIDDENRENEGDFIALASNATPEVINFMITHGRGLVCAPITEQRATKLDLPSMVSRNTDAHGTAFTVSIDHFDTTTGISAYERSRTIQALIDPDSGGHQFRRPGHIFPLIARDGG
ncbi:MAG: 3,4-dihydroxy-2-butanone-4-phosphate synthase, partial [Bacilli bacterium]